MRRPPLAVLLVLMPVLIVAGCFGGPGADRANLPENSDGVRATHASAPVPPGCYRGRLTGEGETCQAMRTDGGKLITLGGPRRGFVAGDRICVCGVRAPQQFCRQGLTVVIREISDTCADIR